MGIEPAPLGLPQEQGARLRRFLRYTQAVWLGPDLDSIARETTSSAVALVSAEMGSLFLLGGESAGACFTLMGGHHKRRRLPPSRAFHTYADLRSAPFRLRDAREHPMSSAMPPTHPAVGPLVSAPLMCRHQTIGALSVGNPPDGQAFEALDQEILAALAVVAATTICSLDRSCRAEAQGRLVERRRIADSLHETLAQRLFVIGLNARWCRAQGRFDDESDRKLATITRLAGRSADELRRAIFALRSPHSPKGLALYELLREQLTDFEARTGLAATLVVPSTGTELPLETGEAVFRIVSEALSNVHKHANASAVMVSVREERDTPAVTVTVQDDGRGLADVRMLGDAGDEMHFGIANMRTLTEVAGGTFRIANNDGQGVMVRATFPLDGARAR